jgi:hypothetical protein
MSPPSRVVGSAWEDGAEERALLGTSHISRLGASIGGAVVGRAGRGTLAVIDAVVESQFAAEASERIMSSGLIDRVGKDIARFDVIGRIAEPLVSSGEIDRLVDRALESPAVDRLAGRILESPAAERLVVRVIEGPLLDKTVQRLLESEDLWLMVDVIAQSPAVTEAIGRQSIGFADQVAGAVRARSVSADDRLEFAARRLLRRPKRDGKP